MPQTADFVLERLREWGVHRIFAYPGDGINGILGAFGRAGGDPEFIQPRHEEMAAFMACAHAKFTGEVGVCMATSDPGAVHLLNGLYDAKMDHQPVVAIVGQQQRISLGALYQQEIDLDHLFADVSEFVQESSAEPSPPRMHGAVYSSVGWSRPRVLPDEAELRKAAEILNEGSRVAILVGQGAAKAQTELIETAELLGAGVAKTLLGREVLPDELPFVTGPIGLLGSMPGDEMVMNCDTFLMVGTSFPYAEWLPEEGSARGVEIDIDGSMIGMRYPMDAHVVGDAKETLKLLNPMLRRKEDRSWREGIEKNIQTWDRIVADRASQSWGGLVNPQAVAQELSPRIPDGAILTTDSGSGANWWARHVKVRNGMQASLSGMLATMGPGVPYAIAARFAYPDRPVIAFEGDGAFQMNGMNEMITIKRYIDRLGGRPPFIFCVFNNQDLNQVTWEQRAEAGDPKFPGSQDLPDVPYHKYAELLGLRGIYCDKPDQVGAACDEALASDVPVVLEFKTDPEVPPLPPHIKKDLGKKSAKAELHDPEKVGLLKHGFRQKMVEYYEKLPGRDK